MIQSVINALSRAINEKLNKDSKYTVYTENVEQGVKKPCFFIYSTDYRDYCYRGKRYKAETDITIEYFPPEDEKKTNKDINSIIPALYDITEYLNTGDCLLRGMGRSIVNTDGGIVFRVQYGYFYYRTDETEFMEILEERMRANDS